jgi:hypothetical protein
MGRAIRTRGLGIFRRRSGLDRFVNMRFAWGVMDWAVKILLTTSHWILFLKQLWVIAMQLRNHPLMRYGSIRNWPPVWISLHEAGEGLPLGEVGVLTEVRKSQFHADRLVLVMEYEEDLILSIRPPVISRQNASSSVSSELTVSTFPLWITT